MSPVGLINYTRGQFSGVQGGWLFGFSAINYAGTFRGIQLGLVNYSETANNGIQLSIINRINNTELWFNNFPEDVAPAMILVNWSL